MRMASGLARLPHVVVGVLAALISACSSVPTRYYTLMAPAPATAAMGESASFAIDVLPVGIPAQVDQPQLVVRTGPGSVAVLDNEHWIAPLADEIRAALADDLVRALGASDARGESRIAGRTVYRIRFDVRRFESVPADHALIESDWSVLRNGQRVASCSSSARGAVDAGYESLVEGQQRALARIAGQIATVVRRAEAGASAPACPG